LSHNPNPGGVRTSRPCMGCSGRLLVSDTEVRGSPKSAFWMRASCECCTAAGCGNT
jgi:hypothetical protein